MLLSVWHAIHNLGRSGLEGLDYFNGDVIPQIF